MEWGTPVQWGRFLLFCVPQSVKIKETNPIRPGSPTPCKQALRRGRLRDFLNIQYCACVNQQNIILAGKLDSCLHSNLQWKFRCDENKDVGSSIILRSRRGQTFLVKQSEMKLSEGVFFGGTRDYYQYSNFSF